MALTLDSLPVELIADVLSELDLGSLVVASEVCCRFRRITSDNKLNPWRRPIRRALNIPPGSAYEPTLKHLSERSTFPRHNFVEILSAARSDYILFDLDLPNLPQSYWEESFKRRYLPSWKKWQRDGSWKEVFLKLLFRVWHRTRTACSVEESWTKYILVNRNGSINELESSSRNFSALAIFNELKLQNNLGHLQTRVRLVVQFADVRILALGVLNKPRVSFSVNSNARLLLHPPCIGEDRFYDETGMNNAYPRLTHPLPASCHENYPQYTASGQDRRIIADVDDTGMQWVGGLMLVAQLIGPRTHEHYGDGPSLEDMDLVAGPDRRQYASFSWEDLQIIAPWLDNSGAITKVMFGVGLGN